MTQIQGSEEWRRRGTEEIFDKDTHLSVSPPDPDTTVKYIGIFQY